MKNTTKILGIIALVAVIGFSMAACNGDDSAEETVTKTLEKARYLTADAAGNVYELVISEAEGRYVGQQNDGYRLGIWTNGVETKTSTGTVATVTNGGKNYGLKRGNAAAFTVEVSDSWITGISGTIPLDNDTMQAAPTQIVERGTIANNETVVYDAKWCSNIDAAKAITDFGYVNADHETYIPIDQVLPETSIKIVNGKVAVTLGSTENFPDDDFDTLYFPEGSGITLTPASAAGSKMLRQTDPFFSSDGTYILVCFKNVTQSADGKTGTLEYSFFAWTEKAFSLSGSATESGIEKEGVSWTFNQKWVNINAKPGWNYYTIKGEYNLNTHTVTETFSVPADSTRPPAGYQWTVFSMDKAESLRPYPNFDEH